MRPASARLVRNGPPLVALHAQLLVHVGRAEREPELVVDRLARGRILGRPVRVVADGASLPDHVGDGGRLAPLGVVGRHPPGREDSPGLVARLARGIQGGGGWETGLRRPRVRRRGPLLVGANARPAVLVVAGSAARALGYGGGVDRVWPPPGRIGVIRYRDMRQGWIARRLRRIRCRDVVEARAMAVLALDVVVDRVLHLVPAGGERNAVTPTAHRVAGEALARRGVEGG